MKETNINGIDLLLYGRLDALKAGVIYDIKFTKSYAVGKFYSSPQHPMYLELIPEARKFVYLVSNGKSLWVEEYSRNETAEIKPTIQDFFEYLTKYNLMPIYTSKWQSRE